MSTDSKGSWVPDGAIYEQGRGILGPLHGDGTVLTLAVGEVAEGGQCGVTGCVWWAEATGSQAGGTCWSPGASAVVVSYRHRHRIPWAGSSARITPLWPVATPSGWKGAVPLGWSHCKQSWGPGGVSTSLG